ncbi:MAG: hypothetical protein Q9167_001306 [Letrouitia subvulpina]
MAKRKRNENEETNERRRHKRAKNEAPNQSAPDSIPRTRDTTSTQQDPIHSHLENAAALGESNLERRGESGSLAGSGKCATTQKVVKESFRQKEPNDSTLKPFNPKGNGQKDIGHQDRPDFRGTSDKASRFEKGIESEALRFEAITVKKEGKKVRKRHRARFKAGKEKLQLETLNGKHDIKALQPARDQQGLQDDQTEKLPATKGGEPESRISKENIARREDVTSEKAHTKSMERTRKKRKRRKAREALKDQDQDHNQKIQSKDMKKAKGQSKTRAEDHFSKKETQDLHLNWNISAAGGGLMLDIDPVYSPDEKHLLLAYHTVINVYSTATSLLLRSLRVGRADNVSALKFSETDSSFIYVSTTSGIIQVWNWLEGQKIDFWYTKSTIEGLGTSSSVKSGHVTSPLAKRSYNSNIVYTVDRRGGSLWMITAHRLFGGKDAVKTEVTTLRKVSEPLRSLNILENGRLILASFGSCLTIGITENANPFPLKDLIYVWRDLQCPEWIASLDTRITDRELPSKTLKKSKVRQSAIVDRVVDIVVGGLKGSIFIYQDLIEQLALRESQANQERKGDLSSRKLHWHRTAVLSVKWSLDGEQTILMIFPLKLNLIGNYLISGGLETVLVLWQLETGSKEILPHLGAPLESIVVSPSGSAYSVRLADNSAMILSTSELKPTFSVAGIRLPAIRDSASQLPHIPTVDAPSKRGNVNRRPPLPATVGPLGLLLAVPSATTSRVPSAFPISACYLQTFDINSSHQISHQALTRTKATDLNMGPELNTIAEPNVIHMQISHDGQWLVTVDEWIPPKRDLEPFAFNDQRALEEQQSRREIFLKFWSWNDSSKTWELVSRFDNPHKSQSGFSSDKVGVLDIAASFSSVAFATIGKDDKVRIWRPTIRRRYGSAVRNRDGEQLSNWNCKQITELPSNLSSEADQWGAKIAFSLDGSVLALACGSSSPWTIHLVDTQDGSLRHASLGPFNGPIFGLGIVGKFLVTLTPDLCVWDLVTETLCYGFSLDSPILALEHQHSAIHLCINYQQDHFAVALPEAVPSKHEKGVAGPKSRLIVFDPANPSPLFSKSLPKPVMYLLPMRQRSGYYTIDSSAEINIISATPSMRAHNAALSLASETRSRGLDDIYGTELSLEVPEGKESEDDRSKALRLSPLNIELEVEEDPVVVNPEKLSDVFDTGHSFVMPPIMELFERVARLFAGKSNE